MGVGIATHFARFGHDIWLYDTEQSRIAEIHVVAGGILDELISCEQFTAPEKENVLKRLSVRRQRPAPALRKPRWLQ